MSEVSKVVKFYSTTDKYGEFSNFSRYSIRINGKTWPSVEHYFQAMKFDSRKDQNDIYAASSPMEAARKGRDRKRKLKRNWDSIKESVMRTAIRAKFSQYTCLKELLLSTGNAVIIEHTDKDSFWGDGGDGSGKNRLGLLLMELRADLSKGA